MEKNRIWKIIVVIALIASITGIGIAFAALSTTLEINGSAKVNNLGWNIKFDNLGEVQITGAGAADTNQPTLTDTAITNVKGIFDGDGSVSYEFDVKNEGSLDAKIGTINILSNPICTGTGTNKEVDEKLVCDSISTSLTYVNGGATVAVNDTLNAGESKRMKFTITYSAGNSNHTYDEVNVSDLGATIIYNEK